MSQPRFAGPERARLGWRAIVKTNAAPGDPFASGHLAWHLTTCQDPASAASHCNVGQRNLAETGDPEGHCLLDGACPSCAETDSAAPTTEDTPPTRRPRNGAS